MKPDFRAEAMRLLRYEPDTGHFYWTATRNQNVHAGTIAGCIHKHGYRNIEVCRRKIKAGRLAWLFMTGDWPPSDMAVDHINRVRDDDRWCNLRLATRTQNNTNRGLRCDSTSGITGVSYITTNRRWVAWISQNNRRTHLGSFLTKDEAIAARKAAEAVHYGAFAPDLGAMP